MHRLAAICLVALLAACDRPKPLGAPPPPPAPKLESASTLPETPPPLVPRRVAAAAPSRPVPVLLADYRSQGEAEKRRAIIWELLGAPPAEGVAAVDQLLAIEKRADLRVELFDSLDSFDGIESAKVAILRREMLEHRTIGEAHEAAIDALLNVQHRDAIPLWRDLMENADDDLRDVAEAAIRALEGL